MAFKKGQSGNPKGRGRGIPNRKTMEFREAVHNVLLMTAPQFVEWLADIAKDDKAKALAAERLVILDKANTVGQLLDRYALEVIPTKAVSSHKRETRIIAILRSVFGDMPLNSLQPKHVYQYVDKRSKKHEAKGGGAAARHEVALLSHAYTKAVQWGYLDKHPFKGEVRLEGMKPRTRYVEDWEIAECLSLPPERKKGSVKMIQAYIKLKLLTGMRSGDLLRLRETALKEDGIHVGTTKTGKPVIYEWSEQLRAVIDEVRAARPVHISPYLFCTKAGKGYINERTGDATGWHSMWQRFMHRVLEETKVSERFTEHDLRAKCASDAASLEHARQLLAHADSKTTDRIYRRKPERVKPAK